MRTFLQKIKALFTKSDVEKTSLQKTARISIILAGIAIVGLIVYFAIVSPLLNAGENYVPELFEGEVYNGGYIYILPTYERDEIRSIEVKNDIEQFKLNTYTDEDGSVQFTIEGNESTALSYEKVSYFIADARNLITTSPAGQERVTVTATEEDLKHYGLDKASDPTWFEVVLNDGNSYRIYVGNSLVTTTGYYVMLEGRKNVVDGVEYDIVYALQSSLADTILSASAKLVSPELAPYDANIYKTTFFSLERENDKKERETIVVVGMVEDQGISASSQVYEMIYPGAYVVAEDDYGEFVLTNLAYISASEIVAYGDAISTPEVYEKYGLDLDPDRLAENTDKNHAVVSFSTTDTDNENFTNSLVMLYFSEKQTDLDGTEYYYVFAPAKNVIGKIAATSFEFVEWSLEKFTNPYLFFEYFTSCEYFEIVCEREGLDLRFNLSGKERTRVVEALTSTGDIVYAKTATGDLIPLRYQTKYETSSSGVDYYGDFERFRDLYYVLITRTLALYADINEAITTADDTPMATLTINTSPKDHPISYVQYSADGTKGAQLRDEGGNILCHEVLVPTTLSDGSIKNISYEKAFYDVEAKRFFLKASDSYDGNEKPAGYEATDIGTVKVNTFLPNSAYGEYNETTYSYEIYDLYDEYVNYDGDTVRSLNSTYKYIVPTTTIKTYRLTSGGERELLKTKVEKAEVGVYIRTASIEKLFSDTHKFLNGEAIDTMGVN